MKKIPWNKGQKGLQVAWNKGKKQSKEHRLNNKLSHIGQDAWNKGTKGVMKPNKTSFVKGQTAHNEGIFTSDSMAAVHHWIRRKYGQPKYCEHCKKNGSGWYDWANRNHTYKRIRKDWMRLCRGCHMKYDYKNNNRIN